MAEKNKIILIVEDDEVLLRALFLQLKDTGYTLTTATDGEKALSIAEKVKPDIILLDLIIPKKDGFEVLKIVRASEILKNIPVLVLSNLGDEESIQKAKKLGANDYFIKSNVNLAEINKRIEFYLK